MKNDTMTTTTPISEFGKNNAKTLLDDFVDSNKSKIHTLLKAVSYRFFGTLATVIISFILTQEISLSLSIGALELVGKIVLFYIHERLWDKIA